MEIQSMVLPVILMFGGLFTLVKSLFIKSDIESEDSSYQGLIFIALGLILGYATRVSEHLELELTFGFSTVFPIALMLMGLIVLVQGLIATATRNLAFYGLTLIASGLILGYVIRISNSVGV